MLPPPPPPPPPPPGGRRGIPPPPPPSSSSSAASRPAQVVPIPLALLLHPIAAEWPYAQWITDAQASYGGVRLPVSADGFRMYFEFARAVLRSPVTDPATRAEARRFAEHIYRVNLEQYRTAPWLRPEQPSVGFNPLKRRFEGGESSLGLGMPRRVSPRIQELSGSRNTSSSGVRSSSPLAGPSTSPAPASGGGRHRVRDDDEDQSMDVDDDGEGERRRRDDDGDESMAVDTTQTASPTPSPERERRLRVAGTSAQRAAAGMLAAKTTNMRGQWRENCVLVPVPNSRGRSPPSDLPPLRTLSALHALDDVNLAAWLRFYDGEDAEVPSTRYAREIALCSRLGVLWSPSAPTSPVPTRSSRSPQSPLSPLTRMTHSPLSITTQRENFPRASPPRGPASAPASVGPSPPSSPTQPAATVAVTAPSTPMIYVTPPSPTHTRSPRSPTTSGPQSAPPASPPHAFVGSSLRPYSYAQTHPRSLAYTHRHRRSRSFDGNFAEAYSAYRRTMVATATATAAAGPSTTAAQTSAGGPAAPTSAATTSALPMPRPQPQSSDTSGSREITSPTTGSRYIIVMRHGVPYAVRQTPDS